MNKNIHFFWLEGELTTINLLTIRSYQAHGHNCIIHCFDDNLTKECELRDASELYPKYQWRYYTGLHHNMRLGLIGDTLRARLLYKYGEIHSDLDVTCLKPIDFEDNYVFRPHNRGIVANFIKCPKNSDFAAYYMHYTNMIDVSKNDWENSFAGLIDGVKKYNLEKYIKAPEVLGMDNHEWFKHLFFEDAPPPSEYIIHWSGSTQFFKEHTENSYFHKLLKQYNLA